MTNTKSVFDKMKNNMSRSKLRTETYINEFDEETVARDKYHEDNPRISYKKKSFVFRKHNSDSDEAESGPVTNPDSVSHGGMPVLTDEFRQRLRRISEEEKSKRKKIIVIDNIVPVQERPFFKWSLFSDKTKIKKIIEFSRTSGSVVISMDNIRLYTFENIKVSPENGQIISMDIVRKDDALSALKGT
jgi:hypothetical protein